MRAWTWAILVALGTFLVAHHGHARVPTRLVYARAPSAVECPDEPGLVAAVAARLGYDPFSPWGDQTIFASVSRMGGDLVGQAQLIDHDGIAQGNREVKVAGADCGELILALALAISITLDPLHVDVPPVAAEPEPADVIESEPPPAAAAEPPPAAEPATSARDVAKPTQRRAPGPSWHARAGVLSAVALAPEVSFGARLGLESRLRRWSLALEGWATLPTTSQVSGGGAIETSLLAASLVPCFEIVSHARLCAVGSLGSFAAQAREVEVPRSQQHVLHASAGARASVAWSVGSWLDLLASADLAATLNRPTFELDGEAVWRPAPLLTVLALEASARFF
jgi:hypothetical protein